MGVSKSHTFKGLVKVGASKGVIRVDLTNIMARGWGGGFPGNQKKNLDTPLSCAGKKELLCLSYGSFKVAMPCW